MGRMLLHRLADTAFWAALVVAAIAPFGAARAAVFVLAAVVWELLSRRPAWFDLSGLDKMDWPRLGSLAVRTTVTVGLLFYVLSPGLLGAVGLVPGAQAVGLPRLLGLLYAVPYWGCLLLALAALAGLWALARPAGAR